jgi:hypothetical protein
MRGGTAAITGSKTVFGLALGAVSCSFKRELKPYESYELWTRVLSWDEKWFYIVTHFVRKGAVMPSKYTLYPQQNSREQDIKRRGSTSSVDSMDGNEAVVATALSKCVFKQGRRTVSPALMLKHSGLLPANKSLDDLLPQEPETVLPVLSCASSDSGIDMHEDSDEEDELARVETERQRGMKVTLANQAQNALEMEFTAESEALGRHSDGTGITGVVSTLAQLAHLKRQQTL